MNYIKMKFICDSQPTNMTLHCLYTTIRYKNEKKINEDELFQIWNDGKIIYIIMDKNKIENNNDTFVFNSEINKEIKIKLKSKEDFIKDSYLINEYIDFSTILSYSYKIFENENSKKNIEICPVNMKGSFKEIKINNKNKSLKRITFEYLEEVTGLDFLSEIDTDKIRFERIFMDEHLIKENKNKKILFKNIISINAKLKIKNIDKFNKILLGSIGKKKNYGFGKCFINKLVDQSNE